MISISQMIRRWRNREQLPHSPKVPPEATATNSRQRYDLPCQTSRREKSFGRFDCSPGMLATRTRICFQDLRDGPGSALIDEFVKINGKQRWRGAYERAPTAKQIVRKFTISYTQDRRGFAACPALQGFASTGTE